jgi:DNA-binding NarL/FixJ family response regulator
MQKITLGLIDDHKIVRQGLRGLLEKMGNYEVIGEWDSGVEFLTALPLKQTPDVLIVDYSMPGLSGVELLRELDKRLESSGGIDCFKALLLTQHFDEAIIDQAYYHGARGFLHKNCTAADLKFALDSIAVSGYTNVMEILKRVKKFDTTTIKKRTKTSVELSPRESDFLRLVCDERELTYEQMAQIMCVSVKSIEAYRSALFDKFNIKSKVGLVLFSYKNKLTPPFA